MCIIISFCIVRKQLTYLCLLTSSNLIKMKTVVHVSDFLYSDDFALLWILSHRWTVDLSMMLRRPSLEGRARRCWWSWLHSSGCTGAVWPAIDHVLHGIWQQLGWDSQTVGRFSRPDWKVGLISFSGLLIFLSFSYSCYDKLLIHCSCSERVLFSLSYVHRANPSNSTTTCTSSVSAKKFGSSRWCS